MNGAAVMEDDMKVFMGREVDTPIFPAVRSMLYFRRDQGPIQPSHS